MILHTHHCRKVSKKEHAKLFHEWVCTVYAIDEYYTSMGKVDRLRNSYLPTPDPVRRPGITPPPYTKYVLYMIIVGSILHFLSQFVTYLWRREGVKGVEGD